jgi:hypothetical protein
MMTTNQGLDNCESMLARLNAALDLAASELACSNAAEARISGMVSRLASEQCGDSARRLIRLPQRPLAHAANENLADCDEVFAPVSGAPPSFRAAC